MLLILLAAQAATVPAMPEVAAKPKKVCQMMEVTGSRSKKRVCRDANGRLDLGPGVKDATGDARTDGAMTESTGGASTPN